MSELQVYEKGKPVHIVENPTQEELQMALKQLDGQRFLGMAIVMPIGRLILDSSPSSRIHVHFTNESDQSGWLLDKSVSDNVYVEFVLYNGQLDEWALCETVSRETATEVVCFLLEYNTLPKGLNWEGHMWRFE